MDQFTTFPALLFIILLSILAWLVEVLPQLNSKFIPHICVMFGGSMYWLFVSVSTVPPIFPYPHVIITAEGMICGCIAFLSHGQIIMRIKKAVEARAGGAEPEPEKKP